MEGSNNQHTSEFVTQPQDGDKVARMVGFEFFGPQKEHDVIHIVSQ